MVFHSQLVKYLHIHATPHGHTITDLSNKPLLQVPAWSPYKQSLLNPELYEVLDEDLLIFQEDLLSSIALLVGGPTLGVQLHCIAKFIPSILISLEPAFSYLVEYRAKGKVAFLDSWKLEEIPEQPETHTAPLVGELGRGDV
jgi:hypothetical protein